MPFFDKNKKAPGEAKGQKKPRLREAERPAMQLCRICVIKKQTS
jgi:hypothetical protein